MSSPQLLTPQWNAPQNISAFVTTRQGGVSQSEFASMNVAQHVGDNNADVARNRQLLLDEFPEATHWQWMDQVHGPQVHRLKSSGPVKKGDGLVTKVRGLACCVMTADCLPVFFASRNGDEVGIAHGGWKGLAAGILTSTVAAMDSPPEELVVWLGPAIGPCHFEVGPEVREAFLSCDGMEEHFQAAGQKYFADLYGIASLQLRNLGVAEISAGDYCTYRDHEDFYSYRRDGRTGRMLNAIFIK